MAESTETVEQTFSGRMQAIFRAGGDILEIQTPFESKKIILSNLHPQCEMKDLLPMAEKVGNLKSIKALPPASATDTKSAELEYIYASSATKLAAAVALDGLTICGRRVTAQLNLKSAEIGTADLRSSTLKVNWFAPSRVAYAHYDSIAVARQRASYLNGKEFNGRIIVASFQQPSFRQVCSFTVVLKGLPEDFKEDDLKTVCKTQSIAVMTANYSAMGSIWHIRSLLKTYGPLESFDCSPPKETDTKIRALARFVRAEDAATAVSKLHGQEFLKGVKAWITLLHSIKYNIDRPHFEALETEIKGVQEVDSSTAKLRVYDKDERGNPAGKVCIRIYGEDPKGLAQLKRQLEEILTGEEVIHEGAPLWDDYFESSETIADTGKIAGAFVRVDSRRRKIYVSGSPENRKLAKEHLLDRLHHLRSDRRQIQLEKHEMTRILRGELTRLRQLLGKDSLSLDIRNRVLTVIGSEDKIAIIRTILNSEKATSFAEQERDASECPVCLDRATEPVELKCNHIYCGACLRQYLETSEAFPVRCFGNEGACRVPIPIPLIRQSLGPQEEFVFFQKAFLTHVRQHPKDFHYCPTSDCKVIYRPTKQGTVLRCFSCLARICAHCHVENHDGLTCEEYKDQSNGGEDSFKRWMANHNIHACPGCGANIEKYAGCNHVTCANCSTHMCWVCLKVFTRDKIDSGDGIYAHMQREHGGIS